MQIGYARVSTQQQTTAPQEDELHRAGCAKIFRDTISGAQAQRPGLDAMLAQVRPGDVIVIVRLDRLGRSLAHLVETVGKLKKVGVGLRSLTEGIDTTTSTGELTFHLFGALAQFERSLIRERVTAGLESARARGRVGGRRPKEDGARQAMAAAMLADPARTVQDVCRALKVSRATAFRLAARGRAAQVQPPPAATPAVPTPIRAATSAGSTAKRPRKAAAPKNRVKTPTAAKPPRKGQRTTTSKKREP